MKNLAAALTLVVLTGCGSTHPLDILDEEGDKEALRNAEVVVLCDIVEKDDLAHYQVARIVRNRTSEDLTALVGFDLKGFGPDRVTTSGIHGKYAVVFVQAEGGQLRPVMSHNFHDDPETDEISLDQFIKLVIEHN